VSLSWSAPTNATSYRLYAQYYSRSSGSWGSYSSVYSGASRSWSQTLAGNQEYAHYYVEAYDQAGWSGASNTDTASYPLPAAPSLSGPAQTTNGSISMSWSAPTGATSFQLYASYQSRVHGTWTTPGVVYSGGDDGYTDTISTGKSNASYYVKACSAAGCGSNSNTVNVPYSLTGGGGGGKCGASCGGCGKVLCFVMPDPDRVALLRRNLQPLFPVEGITASVIPPLPDLTPDRALLRTQLALNRVLQTSVGTLPQLDSVPAYEVTAFAPLPALSRPAIVNADRGTLLALRQARQNLLGHTLQQPSEAAMQAAATQRAEARFASLAPSVPATDRAQWAAWQAAQQRRHPSGPEYAPPAYIAYADAHIEPATSTPYRFTVQYVYDNASGGLAMVANADTGFIYWQAALYGNSAPVDAWGHVTAATDGNLVSTITTYDAATGAPTGISSGIGQSVSFPIRQTPHK
jgi:hypothetical protein